MTEPDFLHWRTAFDSPYLSSADIVEPTVLTISHVRLEKDHTKRTQDSHNTAYFVERELATGQKLKPMILNNTNSKTVAKLAGTANILAWKNLQVTVYVDPNVRFGKETVEGLRISPQPPAARRAITPQMRKAWENAKAAFKRDGDLQAVLARADMSPEHQRQLLAECGQPM